MINNLPRAEPLLPPDPFDYCQSLTCSGNIHQASFVLLYDSGSGVIHRRLLCPLAAAPFLPTSSHQQQTKE